LAGFTGFLFSVSIRPISYCVDAVSVKPNWLIALYEKSA